jgi:phospholipid transport system substrate-binding protein
VTGAPARRRPPAAGALRLGLLACGLLLGLQALSPASFAAPADDASGVVRTTLDQVLAVLRDKALPSEQRRQRVEAIAYAHFDFDTISRLVLARNWPKLSETQRAEFVVEFKRHLSGTYWKTLEDYRDQKVTVDGARPERSGDVTVRSSIEGERADPIRIDYRMRPSGGEWSVIDVIIEGVSLVQNFRSQTQEIIGDVGVDGLIGQLRKKNADRAAE